MAKSKRKPKAKKSTTRKPSTRNLALRQEVKELQLEVKNLQAILEQEVRRLDLKIKK